MLSAIWATVTDVADYLFGDVPLWQAFGDAVGLLVTDLAEDSAVEEFAAQTVAGIVASILAGNPAAEQIGLMVGVVEVGLRARRGADVLLVAGDGEVRTLRR